MSTKTFSARNRASARSGRRHVAAAAAGLLPMLLCGCVSLDVRDRAEVAAEHPLQRRGVEYQLGFSQFEGKLTWRLVNCTDPEIAVETDDVKVASAPDPARRYLVDMTSLASPVKTSNLKLSFWSQRQLKSVSASAEDRSAQIIGSVLKSAVKLFTPAGFGGNRNGAANDYCTVEARQALQAADSLRDQVATKKAELAAADATVESIQERIRLAGGVADATTANQLGNAVATRRSLGLEFARLEIAHKKALGAITASEDFLWPEAADDFGPKSLALPTKARKWFAGPPANVDSIVNGSCVQLWLKSNSGTFAADAPEERKLQGIRYRQSEPGLFEVRATKGAPDSSCTAEGSVLVFSKKLEVLQFGRIKTLPFKNAMFQNNGLEASWDEQGRLTEVGYGVKSASAETVATMVEGGIDTLKGGIALNRGAELARVNAENALLEARAKNTELKSKAEPDEED